MNFLKKNDRTKPRTDTNKLVEETKSEYLWLFQGGVGISYRFKTCVPWIKKSLWHLLNETRFNIFCKWHFQTSVCSASTYLIVRNLKEFNASFTTTTIETTTSSLKDIIFPSIYVCNVNQVSKAFLGESHSWFDCLTSHFPFSGIVV